MAKLNSIELNTPGERIKWLREKTLNLNQEEFAKVAGITQGFLSAVERNQKSAGSEVMSRKYDIL